MKKLLFFIAMMMLILPNLAHAIPRRQVDFNLTYETSSNITVIKGLQIWCSNRECNQNYSCDLVWCHGNFCEGSNCLGYNKLILNFSDKVRESNVFELEAYSANVKVTDSQLIVEDTVADWYIKSVNEDNLRILLLNFLIIFMFAVNFFITYKLSKRVSKNALKRFLIPSFIMNCFSIFIISYISPVFSIFGMNIPQASLLANPIIFIYGILSEGAMFIVMFFSGIVMALSFGFLSYSLLGLVLAEIFLVAFEACLLSLLNKQIPLRKAFMLSLGMNVLILLIGFISTFILYFV